MRENGSQVTRDLEEKIEVVYRHNTLMDSFFNYPKDYGQNIDLTVTDAHILYYVARLPEPTVTHLAEYTHRTKSTISKVLKRLEDKGLIFRRQKPDNKKWVYFELTEKGYIADQLHLSHDVTSCLNMISFLLWEGNCTLEEIESFYKVTAARNAYYEKVLANLERSGAQLVSEEN